jgi:D-sedoheptulose 7-phosphate isomerase
MTHRNGSPPADDIAALHPFLYSTSSDVDAVLEQVRQSTVDKVREIIELRAAVLAADGERLLDCAEAMAERFAAGGRLLAFGNGGSSTDAQDLASLFLSPVALTGRCPLSALPTTSR